MVAPVGDAFAALDFSSALYAADLYHPSAAGTLLASMILYRTIYGEKVSDISYDEDDQPTRVRMTSDQVLGLGARTLEIPAGFFSVLRGAVVVDLPVEAVQTLPELAEQDVER